MKYGSTVEKSYWENKLSGELEKVSFPYDFLAGGEGTDIKSSFNFKITGEVWEGLKKLCGGSDVKLHMVISAGLNILLYKYTGCEDIIIGSPIYKQETAGNFINTVLVLRNTVNGNTRFRDFLLQVRETILKASEHQNYPVERVLNRLNILPTGQGSPFFDVMLILTKIHEKSYVEKIDTGICFNFFTTDEELVGTIEYDGSLYKRTTIAGIALHLNEIFAAVIKDINVPIKAISILTPQEKMEILTGFNHKEQWGPETWLLHELFEMQVLKTPDGIAVIAPEMEITYAKLNEQANQLAGFLRKKGIGPNDIVGIMIEPSVKMIIGLMAILKAGGAYLPLDPAYPKERLQFMLEDSQIKALITTGGLLKKLEFAGEFINIDCPEWLHFPCENPARLNSPGDLSYIIYTSGSTGNPKGVMVEHRAVTETIFWRGNEYGLSTEDTVLQLFSFAFDGFVTSFFTPITRGSKVILVSPDEVKNPKAIRRVIAERKVTHFISVPVLFSAIIENMTELEATGLRVVTLAGDKVNPSLVKTCKEKNYRLELVNEYGPTENTVVSTIFRNMNADMKIKIGKPIIDTQVYILDKDDNLCPVGVCGEICLAGGRLARGYLNRPDLTVSKFVNNPFKNGLKMYRTGDLARWSQDGNIEFLGRKDHQVKIRGFRVELGEIGSRLQEHPAVTDAVVLDRELENGNKYICSYYIGKKEIAISELRAFMGERLPDYMIPSSFIRLESFPVTPNGKIDPKALPAPDGPINTGAAYLAPENEKEERIVQVWQEVLRIQRIGIDDNFFSLGGDSLKAIRVADLLRADYTVEINDLFKYQTVRELAKNAGRNQENLLQKITRVKETVAAAAICGDASDFERTESERQFYDSYLKRSLRCQTLNLETVRYQNIFITGATGFVGAYILREILKATESNAYLLVRGSNAEDALDRMSKKLRFYFGEGFYEQYQERIRVVPGDIALDYLGMLPDEYDKLAGEIDCIINSAAYVKHYGEYQKFHSVNVAGVGRLIEFSQHGRKKIINHLSTMSVASGRIAGSNRVLFTENDVNLGQIGENYYLQTKLEAEKSLLQAAGKEVDVAIFRLGNVVFDSQSGQFQENIEDNAFYKLFRSFIKINCIPEIWGGIFDFSYVDQVAEAVVALFNKKTMPHPIFHIFNPQKVSAAKLAELLRLKYPNFAVKPGVEFVDYLYENIQNDATRDDVENILFHSGLLELNGTTEYVWLCDQTVQLLKRLDFTWKDLKQDELNKMLDYCQRVNFINVRGGSDE